jgi:HK97 family phage major capsid protein
MPDTETQSQDDSTVQFDEDAIGQMVSRAVEDAMEQETSDSNDEKRNVNAETEARVSVDEKERDAFRAFHTLMMMEGRATGNEQMANQSAKQLIRGGHYGERAAQLLNNGAQPADAIMTAREREKDDLARKMYQGEDGPQYMSTRASDDYYSTLVNADGAFLLPTEIVQEIEEIAEVVGAIQGISDTYNHIVGTLGVPGASGADSAMSFIAEGGAITARMRDFQRVDLNPKKVADIIPWTYEIQLEAAQRILNDIQRVMGRAYGKAIDDAALFGDGTSSYNSIDGITSGNRSVTTYTIDGGSSNDGTRFDHIQPDDIKLAKLDTPAGVRSDLTYVFHPDMKDGVFQTFKDSNGAYIFDYNTDGGMETVGGVPVVYSEVLPGLDTSDANQADSVFGVLGNFQYLKLALGQGVTTEEMRTGTITDADDDSNINLGTQDLRALKYRAFFDLDMNFEEAFTQIKSAA